MMALEGIQGVYLEVLMMRPSGRGWYYNIILIITEGCFPVYLIIKPWVNQFVA